MCYECCSKVCEYLRVFLNVIAVLKADYNAFILDQVSLYKMLYNVLKHYDYIYYYRVL